MFRFLAAAAAIAISTQPAIAAPCSDYRAAIEDALDADLDAAALSARRTLKLALVDPKRLQKLEGSANRAGEVFTEKARAAVETYLYQLDIAKKVCP